MKHKLNINTKKWYIKMLSIREKSATGDEETELRANRHAKRYFETNYGINWELDYEWRFPTRPN